MCLAETRKVLKGFKEKHKSGIGLEMSQCMRNNVIIRLSSCLNFTHIRRTVYEQKFDFSKRRSSRNPLDWLHTHTNHKCVKLSHNYTQTSLIRLRQEVMREQQEIVLTTGQLRCPSGKDQNRLFLSIQRQQNSQGLHKDHCIEGEERSDTLSILLLQSIIMLVGQICPPPTKPLAELCTLMWQQQGCSSG